MQQQHCMLALLIRPWVWPLMISNQHAFLLASMQGAIKIIQHYCQGTCCCTVRTYVTNSNLQHAFLLLQAAYGQSTLTITSFFTYVGLGLGFLGSSLALPFGLYVLICQRTTEKYVQVRTTHFVNLPPIAHCLCRFAMTGWLCFAGKL